MRCMRKFQLGRVGKPAGKARLLLVLLLLALAIAAPKPPDAEAAVKVLLKNNSYEHISVAMSYLTTDDEWMHAGWINIAPGETVEPNIITNNRYVYFYAEGDDGGVWDGEDDPEYILRWVVSRKFSYLGNPSDPPPGENPRQVEFFIAEAEEGSLTQNFSD